MSHTRWTYAAMALVVSFPSTATAQIFPTQTKIESGWSVRLDFGLMAAPKYYGDDDYQISALPGIRVTYGDTFFASINEGIGFNLINNGGLRAGPILRYDFGRDQDGDGMFSISGGGTNDLVGLGDVDGTFELGGFVEYELNQFEAYLEVRQGLDGGHDGMVGLARLDYKTTIRTAGPPAFLSIGPTMRFSNSGYTSAYFDVNAAQSAASGLAVYNAGGGIMSYGLSAALTIPITKNAAITAISGYDRLTGDVGNSSLVRQRGSRGQAQFGIFTGFQF